VSYLKNMVSKAGRPVFESKLVQENDPFAWCWKIKTLRFDIGRLQIHTIWSHLWCLNKEDHLFRSIIGVIIIVFLLAPQVIFAFATR
jgi:hypothetical protein